MAVINGTDLVVKIGVAASEVKLACATSCSMTISEDMVDATCKDSNRWVGNLSGNRSWEVTTDCLYDPAATAGAAGDDVADLIIDGSNSVSLIFGEEGSGGIIWTGTARCSTITINGADNTAASYTATFVGNGALVKSTIS